MGYGHTVFDTQARLSGFVMAGLVPKVGNPLPLAGAGQGGGETAAPL